jgi:hypothetical protein
MRETVGGQGEQIARSGRLVPVDFSLQIKEGLTTGLMKSCLRKESAPDYPPIGDRLDLSRNAT